MASSAATLDQAAGATADLSPARPQQHVHSEHRHSHDHNHHHNHGHTHHASAHSVGPLPVSSLPPLTELAGHLLHVQKSLFLWTLFQTALVAVILVYGHRTESLALQTYSYYILFDMLGCCNILVSYLLDTQAVRGSAMYSFGVQRFEVAFGFANALTLMFSGLYALKESLEHALDSEKHTQHVEHFRMLVVPVVLAVNLAGLLRFQVHDQYLHLLEQSQSVHPKLVRPSNAYTHRSIWNTMTAMSIVEWAELIRHSPFVRGHVLIVIIVLVVKLVDIWAVSQGASFALETLAIVDPLAACLEGGIIIWIAYPITVETGKVLLCTTPKSFISLLDKQTREMSTLEGVLEVRNVHLWCVSYGQFSGSLHVRVRRDADERQVRSRIYRKLKEAGLMSPLSKSASVGRLLTQSQQMSTDSLASAATSMSPFYSPAMSSSSSSSGFGYASLIGHNTEWCIQINKDQ